MREHCTQSSKLNLENITCYVVAITIFLSVDPFFVWSSFANGIGVIAYKAMQIISILLLVFQLYSSKIQIRSIWCGISVLGIFFFYCFFTGVKTGTTHPLLIGNVLVYFFYALNVVTRREILLKSFDILRTFFAIALGYTLIIYMLILMNIPVPYVVLQSGEAGRVEAGSQFYQNYFGCLLINQGGHLLYRFTSVFTEPGVVGTFCAFFLAASNRNLLKEKRDLLFLISGILSFSVAFYVLCVIAYALKALGRGKYKFLAFLLGITAVYFIFVSIDFSSTSLSNLQERLTFTDSGLAGDNRIKEAAEASYQAFLRSDLKTVLLGYGYPDSNLEAWQATASYKESVYCLGVLGYGLMIVWFVLAPIICYRSKDTGKNRLMYSYILIFILSQYQRPYMKSLFLAFMLLAGSLYARQSASDESLKQN